MLLIREQPNTHINYRGGIYSDSFQSMGYLVFHVLVGAQLFSYSVNSRQNILLSVWMLSTSIAVCYHLSVMISNYFFDYGLLLPGLERHHVVLVNEVHIFRSGLFKEGICRSVLLLSFLLAMNLRNKFIICIPNWTSFGSIYHSIFRAYFNFWFFNNFSLK